MSARGKCKHGCLKKPVCAQRLARTPQNRRRGPHTHVFACNSFAIPSWDTRKRLHGLRRSVLLSGWSGCRAVSAAVRPLCAIGLSGSCQAVKLGPDTATDHPRMSGSARLLSGCQKHAVRLSEKVLSALSGCRALSGAERAVRGFAVRLSDQGSGKVVLMGKTVRV